MVRTCCVSECHSGKNVPCHTFPKDIERRKKWFQNLNMKQLEDENEIKKLRICYKHFHDNDYSGSPTRRVLLHIAVPSVHMPQQNLELVDNINVDYNREHGDQHGEQHEEQHRDQHEEQHEQETLLNKQNSMILRQEKNQEELAQQQMQLQFVQQKQQEILMQQQKEIENIKKTLNMQNTRLFARRDLEEVFSRISTHCSMLCDYLIDETAQEFIIQWCKFVNKILNGTQQEDYENNYIYNEAKRMSLKFTKKKN